MRFFHEGVMMMINDQTTPYEALKIALQKEIEAYELYKKASEVVNDQSAKKMFTFLVNEEVKHRKLIEDELNAHYAHEF